MDIDKKKINDSTDPVVQGKADERDKYAKLEAVASSEGGKVLITGLTADVVAAIEELSTSYAQMTLQQFVAIAARLNERLSLLRLFTRAGRNKVFLEGELQDLLAEDLQR